MSLGRPDYVASLSYSNLGPASAINFGNGVQTSVTWNYMGQSTRALRLFELMISIHEKRFDPYAEVKAKYLLQGFNSCVEAARKEKNRKLKVSVTQTVIGGVGILAVAARVHQTAPMMAHEFNPMFFGGLAGAHTVLLGYLAPGGVFAGSFLHGTAKTTDAINDFDKAVAGCQAKYGYPNVP